MSTASPYFYTPVFRTEHLDRFAAVERPAETGNQVWTEVHEEVQRILGGLSELVRSRVTHLHVASGRTHGCGFYLFTYVTFSRTDASEIDPVVVGLMFSRGDGEEEGRVLIDADVSGECLGDRIEAIVRRTVPAVREELLRSARELAGRLACSGQRIIKALFDSSRST